MDKLPIISGQDLIKLLLKLDYQVHHQTGSQIILRQNKEPFRRLTIPNHKEISIGTLRAIIRQVGITREEFVKLF